MTAPKPVLTPHGYFRRWIEGSDLSLEANTSAVPSDDRFYVLVAGKVRLATTNYLAATAEYDDLCRVHWEEQLSGGDLPARRPAIRPPFR